jgi:AraC-like DNA-binding protein
VATSVEQDARGIVRPAEGLTRFALVRFDPSPPVARFVDRYWVTSWDLGDGPPHTQHVLPHPAVNVVLTDGTATVTGPQTGVNTRTLTGRGVALGILFRPAGFRPFLGRALATITDRTVPAETVLGPAFATLAAAVTPGDPDAGAAAAAAIEAHVAAGDRLLAALVPAETQPSEATSALVEAIATDAGTARVEHLAAAAGLSVRQLQRRFADQVGLSPKAVIRRYRLFEAAERVRRGGSVDWAALAAELRYSDQPHLVRDFHATFGLPPERYARACAGGERDPDT